MAEDANNGNQVRERANARVRSGTGCGRGFSAHVHAFSLTPAVRPPPQASTLGCAWRRRYEMARLHVAVVIPCVCSMFAGSALRLCVQHVSAFHARRRLNRRVDFFDLSHISISAECLCKKVRTWMEHHSG